MPNNPTTSFIPKQGPVKRSKQTATRQIHVFAVISYVAFITSLIAVVGVFLYKGYIEKQMQTEVNKLSEEIKGFSDADMERVREFNGRIWQTKYRLDNSISLVSVFSALESATVKSATIEQLSLKKENDSSITLLARLNTDSFDSSLFQRGVYERDDIIDSVIIKDLTIIAAAEEDEAASGVTFTATLTVPTEAVPSQIGSLDVADDNNAGAATSTATSSKIELISANESSNNEEIIWFLTAYSHRFHLSL